MKTIILCILLLIPGILCVTPITSCAEWMDISNNLAGDYILETDIDFQLDCPGSYGPLGSPANPFTGTLNGNGHTLSNFQVSVGSDDVGLFRVTTGAEISSLVLSGFTIAANNQVGALVGDSYDTNFNQIHLTGTTSISGIDYVGGLLGQTFNSANYELMNIVIDTGVTVTCTGSNCGGLAGETRLTTLNYCSSAATISNNLALESFHVGGLVGNLQQSTAEFCSATGNVEKIGGGRVTRFAGMFGHVYLGSTVSNCYCTASVTVNANANNRRIGGLFGSLEQGTVTTSYFSGNVETNGATIQVNIFYGAIVSGTVDDCFADSGSQLDGVSPAASQTGVQVVDLSVEPLSTFTNANWDLVTVWKRDQDEDPTFRSEPLLPQIPPPPCTNGTLTSAGICVCPGFYTLQDENCVASTGDVCEIPSNAESQNNRAAKIPTISFSGANLLLSLNQEAILGADINIEIKDQNGNPLSSLYNPNVATYTYSKNAAVVGDSCEDQIDFSVLFSEIAGGLEVAAGDYRGRAAVTVTYEQEATSSNLRNELPLYSISKKEINPARQFQQQVTLTAESEFTVTLQTSIEANQTAPLTITLATGVEFQYLISTVNIDTNGLVTIEITHWITEDYNVASINSVFGDPQPANSILVNNPSACTPDNGYCRQTTSFQFTLSPDTEYCTDLSFELDAEVQADNADQNLLNLFTNPFNVSLGSFSLNYCPQVQQISVDVDSFTVSRDGTPLTTDPVDPGALNGLITLSETGGDFQTNAVFQTDVSEITSLVLVAEDASTIDVIAFTTLSTPVDNGATLTYSFDCDLSAENIASASIPTGQALFFQAQLDVVYALGSKKRTIKKTVNLPFKRQSAADTASETLTTSSNLLQLSPSPSTVSNNSNNQEESSKNMLVIGVAAGVGAAVIVSVVFLIIFLIVRKRRKNKKQGAAQKLEDEIELEDVEESN